uniref:ANAC type transcription factor n=1 Tax=Catharanthus roseus TaxID=4058 RepID=A0A8A6LNT8_CATRO|nr:ANAC type transcription factor [Catharanthus roseus]
MISKGSSSLAPGFRFHPTDEELVRYYLRRKICSKPFRFDAISEIDIYKAEPWDLPGMSKLKTRDLEWYFFSVLDKKYGNGSRTNRATDRGYWKTTGKDRPVYHKSQVVGMKKTLVYHSGRAPKGQRTNWVMHEYRLIDEELGKAGISQDAFVLCRVFQKSGSGPKNGEQYGAPFVEEEWEEDELEILPKDEAADEVEVGDDAYLDGDDLKQILAADIQTDNVSFTPNCYTGEDAAFVEEATESIGDSQKLSVGAGEYDNGNNQSDDQNAYHLPVQYDMYQKAVKHEYIGESSKTADPQGVDYLLEEPFVDASDNLQFGDGGFLETNDLSNPIDADAAGFDMLEEYLTFLDADGDIAFDPLIMEGGQNNISGESSAAEKDVEEGIETGMPSKQLEHDNDATSSKEASSKFGSGYQYPFMKQASQMLGSFPAPPAFASEFPSKDVALRLNSASQPSSSVHVTAGMIRIRNMSMDGHGTTDWFLGKHSQYNVTLSFGVSGGDDNSTTLESAVRILPGKAVSPTPIGWFCFIFFWVLLLSVSYKIGTLICAQ